MNRFQSGNPAALPIVVKNLLIINVLFFIATWIFADKGFFLENLFGAFYFVSPNFKIWQVITYMFMHADFAHIFFNMFALYMFGSILENVWGPKRFLFFYFVTGLGALFLQWMVQGVEVYSIVGHIAVPADYSFESQASYEKIHEVYSGPLIGASGAIFGLLIAFGMLFPNAEIFIFFIPIPVKAKYLVPVYILVELFLGFEQFSGDNVAHFAHVGGALVGFIIIKIWDRGRPSRLY